MAIVSLEEMKEQLGITPDMGAVDDALITRKIAASQEHIERLLGYKIADNFAPEEVPASLHEAVCQLAAWWYEQRESALIGVNAAEIPHGVWSIVNEYREWSFGHEE